MWFFDAFRLAKRCAQVEERMAALERAFHALDGEWTDQLDRYRRLHGRIAKRAALIEQDDARQEREEPAANAFGADPSLGPAAGGGLSERARSINAQILARRSRILGGSR